MSAIHNCNDGTKDVTGRGTPPDYVPCANNGGEVGKATKTQMAGLNLPFSMQTALIGVLVVIGGFFLWKRLK